MKLDKSILWSDANEILNTISNPRLLKKLIAVKTLPKEKRINAAAQHLTLSNLKRIKIKMPEGARISCQYYEEQAELDFLFSEIAGPIHPRNQCNRIDLLGWTRRVGTYE